ncbi:Uncharacterized protein, PA2063/DUF2235 family [Jannaschia faecimaris]|uniref:Uncharacterized protein, PA2063/DUF2235 family n=1 Tax=Jannaschia faecimaris TaxID=1244108 RepID=A0A1H3S2R8_9RHOB|nr:DUF2235 domain-containing protein [Jannaschia faecimaris]SDZ32184.1 Uncharacterized protein, PA2063/DUF2235 family [Jannaschia faecimaris]
MGLRDLFDRLLGRDGGGITRSPVEETQVQTHVVLLDGTMSTLRPGWETSIGLIYRLLASEDQQCLYYEPGLEWRGWRHAPEIMAGVGINHQIRRAYMFLAHRYRPGDRVFLLGYSRGAYAVRALAGMIDRIGLLRPEFAEEEMVLEAYTHYRDGPLHPNARRFATQHCHQNSRITAVGVLDTVQAVGIRWPVLWRVFPEVHAFRSHRLGQSVDFGFHAMGLDETRKAYSLDRWRTRGKRTASVEQVWFRGTHGDVGGHLNGHDPARPLSNVPLVWLLSRLEDVGLDLPEGWRDRFPQDSTAPSVGNWRGFGPVFLSRRRRVFGEDPSEWLHPTATDHPAAARLNVWDGKAPDEQDRAVEYTFARKGRIEP